MFWPSINKKKEDISLSACLFCVVTCFWRLESFGDRVVTFTSHFLSSTQAEHTLGYIVTLISEENNMIKSAIKLGHWLVTSVQINRANEVIKGKCCLWLCFRPVCSRDLCCPLMQFSTVHIDKLKLSCGLKCWHASAFSRMNVCLAICKSNLQYLKDVILLEWVKTK